MDAQNTNEQDNTQEEDVKFNYFKTLGRIAIIFFVGLSVYLFISTIIVLFLTKPLKEVKVPDVIGKRFVEVHNRLRRIGLNPEIKFYDVFDIENGIVLTQYPESGTIIKEGGTLKLVVSRSSLMLDVPNLVGIELPFAVNKLKNLHIYNRQVSVGVGVTSYIPSEKSADNIIIAQSPRAGERITQEQRINLLVSAGTIEPEAKMPDVIGQSIDLAFDLLIAKGVSVIEEIVPILKKEDSGKILGQTPVNSTEIKKGDTVRIRIGYFKMRDHPFSSYEQVDYLIPADEQEGMYEAVITDDNPERVRFAREMKPGGKIHFVFHRKGNAIIRILCNNNEITVIRIKVDDFE